MRKIVLLIGLIASTPVYANCVGSGNLRTCFDNDGNVYTTSRIGNQTITNGSNARTGSTWNQSTHHGSTMSTTTGRASNGSSWNSTTTRSGTFGNDSSGRPFYNPNVRRQGN